MVTSQKKNYIDISKVVFYNSRMYIKRELYNILVKTSTSFPVVMLTGPRQAGKTTLMRKVEPKRRFITLDDLEVRSLAKNDPKTFLDRYPPPVLIDEFQYAPELLPYIKICVDDKRTRFIDINGSFWLTGSQNFSMMEGVQESLAGRVAILNLLGLSRKEIEEELTPGEDFIVNPVSSFETEKGVRDIFRIILRGDKPELWANPSIDTEIYYRSYVQTYIERDVFSQIRIKDIGLFEKFLRLLASRVGQLLNFTSLAAEVGVSAPTVKLWLTILERTFQIFILPAYYRNIGKRTLKTPKVYFLDSGLLCYFLKFYIIDNALSSYLAGSLFENWVISEIVKSYWFKGKPTNLYFWRTKEGTEVDIIYESGGKLYPVEIKLTASPKKGLFASLEKLTTMKKMTIGRKKIICTSKYNLPLNKDTDIVSALAIE